MQNIVLNFSMVESPKKIIHVAVGVIENDAGEILLARRADHQHQGGLWEFPGGKVESDESVDAALKRELKEELDIDIENSDPLIQIRHDYNDKSVFLDVRHVKKFSGSPCGNEGQPIVWAAKADLNQYQFPAANKTIVNAIQLPRCIMISGAALDSEDFIQKLISGVDSAGGRAEVLLLRPSEYVTSLAGIWDRVEQICEELEFSIWLSSSWFDVDAYLGEKCVVGLHLNSQHLMSDREWPVSDNIWCGASCHNDHEVAKAHALDLDYIFLSPVNETSSHPEAAPLGWDGARELSAISKLPAYALGGVMPEDLDLAKKTGMQGIATISAFWS